MSIPADRIARAAYVSPDLLPQLDPGADFWRDAIAVQMQHDAFAKPIPEHGTEVRIAWTGDALHLLFLCHYKELHLGSGAPVVNAPTDELWTHDVAEIFIAAGAGTPTRYAEFEISPRGEWLALDIQTKIPGQPLGRPLHADADFAASIDAEKKVWLGMMKIPFAALSDTRPTPGMEFRMNLFRSQGTRPVLLAWQPTMHASFHLPASFGLLILAEKQKR